MATNTTTIKFTGQFDSSGITKGLQEIKKQITSSNISEELKKQLQDSFNKVEVNLPKLDKFIKKEDFNLKELAEYQKLVQEITKDMTNFSKVANEADFTKNFSEQDTARLKKFDEQIRQVDNRLKTIKEEIIKTFSNSDKGKIGGKNNNNNTLNGFIEQLISVPPDKIEEKLNEVIKDAETQADQVVDRLQTIFKNKATGHQGGKGFIELLFGENSGASLKQGKTLGDPKAGGKGAYSVFNDIREQVLKLEKDAGPDKINPIFEAYSKFIEEFFNVPKDKQSVLSGLVTPEIVERLREFKGSEGIEGLKQALGEGNLKLLADGEAEKLRLTQQHAEELKKTIEGLAEKGAITRTEADNLIKKFTGLSGVINDNTNAAKHLDNQHKALDATFGGLARRITNSISALTIFNKSIQVVHKAIDSVKELDAAFTQIAIVSGQTNEQAWQMFDSFNKLAKQYSITTKDLTEGAKLFYQQGLNASDTMKMVEASTISAALGEVTMTEAANTLTAAIQGYNESASVAMDYTDKIAMVGAVSAADFNELSAAMEKTASSAYTAGIDFDHLLGYLGKMIEVTREAPANLGTAMKTIIARFEDMKKDPNALIDGASANKVEAALATIGIALRDTAGEFRPLQDVFDELGMKWETLTRNQQAYIATVAAGSRQQSRFLAMMNNYDRTLDLIAESQNSAGAALKQYEIYQNSAAAATARLTAAWEEFYSKIVNSDMIVGAINSLVKLVEIMSKIGPTWSAVIATIGAHTINKIIKGQVLSKILSNFFTISVPQLTEKGIIEPVSYSIKEGLSIGIQKWIAEKTGRNVLKNGMELATAEGVTAGIGTALKSGLTALAPFLGITAALTGTFLILMELGKAAENNAKKYEDLYNFEGKVNKEFIEQTDKIKQQKNDIKDNLKIYEEYENKIVLSNEELQEQNNAVDNLKENNDKLIIIVDELGKKYISNKEILKEQTKELEQQEKISNQIIASNKLNAIKKNNLQDLSIEQLVNSGYTQNEAELLNKYGDEIFKYRRNNTAWYKPNTTPDQNLAGDIKKEMSKNKISNIIGLNPFDIQKILQNEDLQSITDLIEKLKYSLSLSNNESLDNVLNFIIEKAELAKDGLELINKSTQNYVKSMLSLDSEFVIGDNFLQNSFLNLFNNLDVFNNSDYFKRFEKMSEEEINDEINKITNNIQENIDKLSPNGQNKFNELSKKLLDPTLSPNQKEKMLADFNEQVGEITGELKNIVDQYIAGSNVDIARREKLSESLGINQDFLKEYNSRQLQIIDQLRTANKNTDFNLGNFILSDTGNQLLKALSTLEHDITEDPSIYNKAQDIMVKFFKQNFHLEPKEAYDTFQAMFGDLPELVIDAAQDALTNAKNLVLTDPTKALTKKQSEAYQELESLLGESLQYYILINEEGEEYLSIAGRIAIYEKASQKYENALLADIGDKKAQQKQIKEIFKDLTEEQQKQLDLLDKEIELDEDKLRVLQETRKYTAQTTAALNNIEYATGYNKNIKAIRDAQKEMQRVNGVLDTDTAKTLISMGNNYRQYLNEKIIGDKKYYTLTKENADLMIADQDRIYQKWLDKEKGKLEARIVNLTAELEYYEKIASGEYIIESDKDKAEFKSHEDKVDKELIASEQLLENQLTEEVEKNDKTIQDAETSAQQFQNIWSTAYTNLRQEWNQLATAMGQGVPTDYDYSPSLQIPHYSGGSVNTNINTPESNAPNSNELDKDLTNLKNYQRRAEEQVSRIKETIERLRGAKDELDMLGPDFEDVTKGSDKTTEEMKKLTKILEDSAKALENLNKLLKELKFSLNDIKPDYNPFTELFEAWEHEWDYYYNIKRLIAELGQQGQFIDNIISADFVSADQKVSGYHAKIGNLIAQMAANDTYITSLRTGMSQTALELMKDYGEYYKINPDTGQIYQTDKNLNEINTTINAAKEELYNLSKVQNTRQNDLNLENSKLEALEKEKSAYESILSEVESQIDSYKNLDDIIVDTSELEANRSAIKAKIEISDESIEAQKEKIREMEDEIQNFEIEIELKGNVESKLEEYVDKMEEKVQEYEEYWDTLNSTIEQQQEILSQLNDVFKYYVDTAISTEQEIYDAIVENYQDEINKKKQQYDYLKQLDKDYLASVKENINKERQAREDTNKQKNYQQNLQRMQLLQQDTSGAYRNELAQLGKEIEGQRQDLYDDLVDKQVDALEKEINKRHELYDKEVAALEERLAYMQENAILLWEIVNNIVAEGSENMMATLENTTAYINSNELSRQKQRKQWEQNIEITYDGVVNNQIDNINTMVEKGKDYVGSLQEIRSAIETNIETYQASTEILIENNSEFQNAMDNFMSEWNRITYRFTGYYESWEQTVEVLKMALDNNIQALISMNNEGGSIRELDKSLRNAARDMYNDFIAERQRYRNELEGLIQQIKAELSGAVRNAGNAIQSAAASAQVQPKQDTSSNNTQQNSLSQNSNVGAQNKPKYDITGRYRVVDENGKEYVATKTLVNYNSVEEAEKALEAYLKGAKKGFKWISYILESSGISTHYKKGGLANFTGPAWLDGSPSNPERILSPRQTKLFESMVHSLEKSANSNINSSIGSSYNIGDINTTIQVDRLDNETDVNKLVKQVEDKILKTIRNRVVVSV